ncbi:MAG TPA: rhodanese-like domain-containing protein [Steroidobacteraceae bacterium]|nr:rhodanese-like domain-containing protein [Steroidobacteraceae bacterium]HRX88900.1 rhodanese-like domain-containing protein [Steroidobacteraceae bacterium]
MDKFLQYASNHPGLVGLAVLAAVLVIAYEMRERGSSAASVSPQEMIRLQNQGALVLDIRKAEEFAAGHIVGARHLASDQILTAGDSLKKFKEKPVIVYCATGSLAAAAVRQLQGQGFTKAFNLRGGLTGWRTDNLPVAKGA